MQTILIVLGIALGGYILYNYIFKSQGNEVHNTQRPDVPLPTIPVKNDKLILVRNVEGEKIEKVIQEFCDLNNEYGYEILPRLSSIDTEHWITLPYDVAFDGFCYLVNYLNYPCGINGSTPQLLGWCTPKEGETWVTEEMANKRVMLFIPDWDDEHDNVYLTTQDNIGYKMGFGSGYESMRLEKPVNPFVDLSDHFEKRTIVKEIDFK